MKLNTDICIVGAGATGLTLAHQLLKAGKNVVLIERSERIGGLAKSFHYEGGHTFDTGPKRFHTNDEEVLSFINEIADSQLTQIKRYSALHYQGRIIDWPLSPATLLNLPFKVCVKSLIDQLFFPYNAEIKSFEDLVLKRYGRTLAESFFRPYTEKFLKIPANQTHRDWAHLGINRTVVDREASSILGVAKDLIPFVRKPDENFYYPTQGGFGGFFEKIFEVLKTYPNFVALTGQKVQTIEHCSEEGLNIDTEKNQSVSAKKLVWTGNLNQLLEASNLDSKTQKLMYLNTLLFNIIIKKKYVTLKNKKIQWLYISSGERLISRISFPVEFHSTNHHSDYYNFSVEVTSSKALFQLNHGGKLNKLKDQVLAELVQLGFITNVSSCDAINYEFIADSYPIYDLEYKKKFGGYQKVINQFSNSIILSGRTGSFWYNNSDHSIKMALNLSKKILANDNLTNEGNIEQDKEAIFS